MGMESVNPLTYSMHFHPGIKSEAPGYQSLATQRGPSLPPGWASAFSHSLPAADATPIIGCTLYTQLDWRLCHQ